MKKNSLRHRHPSADGAVRDAGRAGGNAGRQGNYPAAFTGSANAGGQDGSLVASANHIRPGRHALMRAVRRF